MENESIYNKQALEMLTVANEYCIYMSELEKYSQKEILTYLHHLLPLLYLKGSLIKPAPVSDPSVNERYVNEEQWEKVFNILRQKFGNQDTFLLIDPAETMDLAPKKASISELLSDIYQDLKDFILLYQKNSQAAKENALFEIKQLFENNWGMKSVQALTAIHHNLYQSENDKLSHDPFDFL